MSRGAPTWGGARRRSTGADRRRAGRGPEMRLSAPPDVAHRRMSLSSPPWSEYEAGAASGVGAVTQQRLSVDDHGVIAGRVDDVAAAPRREVAHVTRRVAGRQAFEIAEQHVGGPPGFERAA